MRFVAPMAASSVRAAVEHAATAPATYDGPEVLGLDSAPPGFVLVRYDTVVGDSSSDFERARDGLGSWATHRVRGVGVLPAATPVRLDATYVVTLGAAFASIAAPCRVTRVTDEAQHWGFAYRTLSGHPERGEEAFDLRVDDNGVVRFEITALSRHADVLTELAGPLARAIQRRVTRAYGRALRDFVRDRTS